jgi:hypothetical protein
LVEKSANNWIKPTQKSARRAPCNAERLWRRTFSVGLSMTLAAKMTKQ